MTDYGSVLDKPLGSHLLGGKPMPEDKKDYKLVDFLQSYERAQASTSITADSTIQDLVDAGLWRVWHDTYAIWAYVKTLIAKPSPTPTPAPSPIRTEWQKMEGISDQGQTGHCVGFTGLDWGNTLNINDNWSNSVGHDIYYKCKIVDGEPGAENGSDSRALCKVLKQTGRVGAYAFAANADEAMAYVLNHGPVGIGVDWMNDMFNPDANGLLHLTGGIAGGHEIEINAADTKGFGITGKPTFQIVNHWTAQWGNKGCAYLLASDLDKLLADGGDVWAALENPL